MSKLLSFYSNWLMEKMAEGDDYAEQRRLYDALQHGGFDGAPWDTSRVYKPSPSEAAGSEAAEARSPYLSYNTAPDYRMFASNYNSHTNVPDVRGGMQQLGNAAYGAVYDDRFAYYTQNPSAIKPVVKDVPQNNYDYSGSGWDISGRGAYDESRAWPLMWDQNGQPVLRIGFTGMGTDASKEMQDGEAGNFSSLQSHTLMGNDDVRDRYLQRVGDVMDYYEKNGIHPRIDFVGHSRGGGGGLEFVRGLYDKTGRTVENFYGWDPRELPTEWQNENLRDKNGQPLIGNYYAFYPQTAYDGATPWGSPKSFVANRGYSLGSLPVRGQNMHINIPNTEHGSWDAFTQVTNAFNESGHQPNGQTGQFTWQQGKPLAGNYEKTPPKGPKHH